jgi:hypothetical protein
LTTTKAVGYSDKDGLLGDLANNDPTEDEKNGRLTPINVHKAEIDEENDEDNKEETMNFLRRQNKLLAIITPDIIRDDRAREEKIIKLAATQIPLPEIEDVYKRHKNILKRTAKISSRHEQVSFYNDDENRFTLEKQLKVLEGEI